MARLAILTGGGEPSYSTNMGLLHGFRALGHKVIAIGPGYWGRNNCDIELPDCHFPELYSYATVLEKLPWMPEFLLNVEPHSWLTGTKPPGLLSAFYCTDIHRGGLTFYNLLKQGSFDVIFNGQPYFTPLLMDIPNTRIIDLPPGFDERRFPEGTEKEQIWYANPVVDIAFIGQTGITGMEYPYEDGFGRYATKPPPYLEPGIKRYAFHAQPSLDYCERAEILIRLCRDFQVRMYGAVWETPNFQRCLQAGAIGFNRSILRDITIRCYEIMAAGRYLVTDEVPYLEESIQHPFFSIYQSFYKPFFESFDLEYKQIYRIIKKQLDNPHREDIARDATEYTWKHHSWRCRVETIFNSL